MNKKLTTLGIETSCDETAVAIIDRSDNRLASIIDSQIPIHSKFGGIVPEIAGRAHVERLPEVISLTLDAANLKLTDLDLVAVTQGPGLVGSLLVGLSYAKSLAWGLNIPLVGVNHIEAHMESALIGQSTISFPILFLVVSGGHTELYLKQSFDKMFRIGGSRDDAAGEAFDKVARLLGLGYPGGPAIEKLASGSIAKYKIPIALDDSSFDFSFSGPKTATKNLFNRLNKDQEVIGDIAASFQESVVEALYRKVKLAIEKYRPATVGITGGVACNGPLRSKFANLASEYSIKLLIPSTMLCQDNGEMVAFAGLRKYLRDEKNDLFHNFLQLDALPSWLPTDS
ncbi:MAG: tRNA (adenosine(37)-N6)-threonylcarbamoyltransferase complex transferase subunit TsaD [Nitrospinota bacterium]